MSGHSKWSNTKHRKAAQDAKRGNTFTKIIRDIITAVKHGGTDPSINARLRTALNKAWAQNMSRDTINRAIMRGTTITNNTFQYESNVEEITYEAYGPGGTAIMLKCLSDNRKRTVSKLRSIFTKYGGNLAVNGSVSYLFKKTGLISLFYTGGIQDEEKLINIALDTGAEDVSLENSSFNIFIKPELLIVLKNILITLGFQPEKSQVLITPIIKIELNEQNTMQLLKLIEQFQFFDDIKEIFHNANI
ncbi:MAG: YebC/PmpR family DNA-binding transcriptional regulator [Candidatus Dasytiphilus stammeri]